MKTNTQPKVAESKAEPIVTVEAPTGGTKGQARALKTDTKIADRTRAAVTANGTLAATLIVMPLAALAKISEDAVRASARGTMLVAPGAYIVAIGTTEPTARAPQHQLAVAALKQVLGDQDPKTHGADLHTVQLAYEKLGGTDLSIFTGKTRLFTNSSKSAKKAGVAQAPLTVYAAPLAGSPAQDEPEEGGEGEGGDE